MHRFDVTLQSSLGLERAVSASFPCACKLKFVFLVGTGTVKQHTNSGWRAGTGGASAATEAVDRRVLVLMASSLCKTLNKLAE